MREIWSYFLSALFPDYCLVCKKEGTLFCKKHIDDLPNAPHNEAIFHYIDDIFASTSYYDKNIKKLITEFKFQGNISAGKVLGKILKKRLYQDSAFLKKISSNDREVVMIPLPLHFFRRFFRGFNQSEILAKTFNTEDFIYQKKWLHRHKYTIRQSHLSQKKRLLNMQNSFVVPHRFRKNIKGKTFLIVDDVVATGASLDQAAKTLKDLGADSVFGIVVARGASLLDI